MSLLLLFHTSGAVVVPVEVITVRADVTVTQRLAATRQVTTQHRARVQVTRRLAWTAARTNIVRATCQVQRVVAWTAVAEAA
jgi:hypothetical protein